MSSGLVENRFDITDDDILAIEARMIKAFADRSIKGLSTLGFGEIGVPLAWPDDNPRLCVKRLNSSRSADEINELTDGVRDYIAAVEAHVEVIPTELRTVVNDHKMLAAYLVQPIIPRDHLLENVLADTTPTEDHPAVLAVRDVIEATVADKKVALDSQLSNFVWNDGKLSFFDIGTPFRVNPAGEALPLPDVMMATMPTVLRPIGSREALKVMNQFATTRGNMEHAAISVARLGLDDWIEPVVATFNKKLDGEEPLTTSAIHDALAARHKDMGTLKNLMKVQRAWAEKVRRQPYAFFITDSFSGEVI